MTDESFSMNTTATMNDQAIAYLRNRVMSARPEELRLMLIEGGLRFAHMGREGLESKNFEQSFNGISQCQAVLSEMITGLDRSHSPELVDRLHGLYSFIYSRTVDAGLEKDPAIMDEVTRFFDYERETWIMLMEKLVEENDRDVAGTIAPDNASMAVAAGSATPSRSSATSPGSSSPMGSISIQG